ncbi:DinB family protein [Undibacterium sp. TS12]|uniref:DinB family protein n=1 Tax=Undibacterium sp. TS12 TaxID=2908202 RepID=UPI001F4C8CCB|nr:DinB family protein [Undibacterium sp. TS12]MCH8619265.1 DinB family protein [Undibacterium sp. TS12]
MSSTANLVMLSQYKAWADNKMFEMLDRLPQEEVLKQRATRFGNMLHTLNHVYVIDTVFRAHLLGQEHGYRDRNTDTTPPLPELWQSVREMGQWYVDYAKSLNDTDLAQAVHFTFIGGGDGCMSRQEILLHVINHSTYHRGFVGDMMYQAGVMPQSTDLTVFVRDVLRN